MSAKDHDFGNIDFSTSCHDRAGISGRGQHLGAPGANLSHLGAVKNATGDGGTGAANPRGRGSNKVLRMMKGSIFILLVTKGANIVDHDVLLYSPRNKDVGAHDMQTGVRYGTLVTRRCAFCRFMLVSGNVRSCSTCRREAHVRCSRCCMRCRVVVWLEQR